MKATIYTLNPSSLHWYKSESYEDVDNELYQQLQAYAEYHQGQVRVEYEKEVILTGRQSCDICKER